jgi:hypothetical protein
MYVEDYFAAQLVLLRSSELLNRTLLFPDIKALPFVGDGNREKAIAKLQASLSVSRHPDAKDNVVDIHLVWTDEEEGKKILSALIRSYQNFLDETYKTVSDRTLELMFEAKKTLTESLASAEQMHADFRKANANVMGGVDQVKSQRARHDAFEEKVTALKISQLAIESRLSSAEKAVAQKPIPVAFSLKVVEWADRSGFNKLPKEARQELDASQAYVAYLKHDLADNQSEQAALNRLIENENEIIKQANYALMQDERLRNRIITISAIG